MGSRSGAVRFAMAVWLGLAAGRPLRGQSIISDQVPPERLVSEQDKVKTDMDNARFTLGPIRILPSFFVPNAGYNSNIFATPEGPVGDWTATIAAGARFLVPFASKMYLRINAFPSYTWYATYTDRDTVGGTYDASILGFFNHMFLEARGFYNQGYQIYSSQLPTLALTQTDGGSGNVEVKVSARISILTSGDYQDIKYTQPGGTPAEQLQVALNNRVDTAVRGGLRYYFTDHWNIGALVEETWSDFKEVPETRNNSSTGYLMTIGYNQPRFYINVTGGYREGRAIDGSAFPHYATPTGSFFLSFFPIRWLEIQGYGHRSVDYSVTTPLQPYYYENRAGGGINVEVLSRILLRGFAQAGPNEYPSVDPNVGTTKQQVLIYGAGISVQLIGKAVLTGTWTRNDYGTNVFGGNSYNTFIAGLSFSGELQR